MTSPIVLRSEILSLLQTGGLGNAGTSGSSTLASLNSQLISLTSRVAKLEGSATYQDNDEPSINNWNYIKQAGVCYAAGNEVLTKDYTTADKIKLAVISDECVPLNTEFVGVASLYDSDATTGATPLELRMGFEENILYAYPESYISASSDTTKYLKFQTMWFPRKELTDNADNTAANYTRTTLSTTGSSYTTDNSKYYMQIHASGGVHFFCGYLRYNAAISSDSLPQLTSATQFSSTTWKKLSSGIVHSFGSACIREGNSSTVHQGFLQNNGNYIVTNGYPAISSTENYIYFYGVAFSDTPANVTFGDYEVITDYGSKFKSSTTPVTAIFFRVGEFNYVDFIIQNSTTLGDGTSWTAETVFSSTKMPSGLSANNLMMQTTSSTRVLCPVDLKNSKCILTLKPSPPIYPSNLLHGCCIAFHDSAH